MGSVSNGESSLSMSGQRMRESYDADWSSLPVLLLWMVKDKLDVFDNKSFAAVCRGWRSASNCYPKVILTVGDGLPWITTSFSMRKKSLEFVDATGERKFNVNKPESSGHWVLFSKQGWILLQKHNGNGARLPDSLFLVNFFTRAELELPPCPINMHSICFTINTDGYPQRVFLLVLQHGYTRAIIKTACPGDKEWTNHTHLSQRTKFSFVDHFITIGNCVYCVDKSFRMMAFNVADQTWKKSPLPTSTLPRIGFVVEHEGGLIFVKYVGDREVNSPYRFGSFLLYRYNNVTSSWRKMRNGEVNDTSWYYHKDHGCITTKGKGLKIYHLLQEFSGDGACRTWVEVYDLLAGRREIQRDNYQIDGYACWVDIG